MCKKRVGGPYPDASWLKLALHEITFFFFKRKSDSKWDTAIKVKSPHFPIYAKGSFHVWPYSVLYHKMIICEELLK